MRVRCFFLVVMAVFIASFNPIYSQSQWRGYVLGLENYVEPDERVCDFVNQGIMMIPPRLSAINYYWTGFQMQDIFCIKNNFTFEIRLKNAARDGGIEAFDVGINLPGSSTTLSSNFVGIGWGQEYTSISIGNTTVANRPEFVLNLSDWATIKIELKDKRLRYYYNDRIIFTTNYNDDICYLRGFNIGFKGSGAVDWIRLSDENSRVIYFEDFLNCNSFARGCSDRLANRATPDILQENDELVSTSAETYQWYFNNTKILGATGQRHKPTQIGNYLVEVTDKCSPVAVRSQPFSVNAFPLAANLNLTISPETEQTASIGQTVRYAITLRDGSNQPVSAALVGVENGIARQTQSITNTNSNGQSEYSYTIPPNTAAGTYTLTFHANKSGTSLSASASRTIRVSASTLPFATFISGRVKTPADIGVRGITVRLNTGQTATTEPDGTYTFRNIPIETNYTVSVDVPNSYRLLGSSRQVRIGGLGTFAQRQDFTIVRDAQQDELIKIHVIEKVPGMVKKVELWFTYIPESISLGSEFNQSVSKSTVDGVAWFKKDDFALNEVNIVGTTYKFRNTNDLYLLDANDQIVGKITGFNYKVKDLDSKRRKEVIVILHNDLVSYQQHPIEKAGTPVPSGNPYWNFANYYKTSVAIPATQNVYQTTMLVPPQTAQGEYLLSVVRPSKKPVIWIHGVSGTDGYWGNNTDIVDTQTDTPENNFNGKKDYPFTSYTGRFQRLEWVKDNCDAWEYYYPPDQAWQDSGYLLSRDIKEVVSKYGNQPANIVAHSMGGLVTRSYIEETAENYIPNGTSTGKSSFGNDIDKVLFLGTPHNGSFGATRLYWGVYLPVFAQTWATGKDGFAPAYRELGVASSSLLTLNNKSQEVFNSKVTQRNIQYLQLSGTTWKGLTELAGIQVTAESDYHEDGVVSISSSSLLNFGIPLGLMRGYSHAHLNSPDIASRRAIEMNAQQKQYIPRIAEEFMKSGNINTYKSNSDMLVTYIDVVNGISQFPKESVFPFNDQWGNDREEIVKLDISLPIVSLFYKNQSGQKFSLVPKKQEIGSIYNSGWRLIHTSVRIQNTDYVSFQLSKADGGNIIAPLAGGRAGGIAGAALAAYTADSYNQGGQYLYGSANHYSSSSFKQALPFVNNNNYYAYEKKIPAFQGAGWNIGSTKTKDFEVLLSFSVNDGYFYDSPQQYYLVPRRENGQKPFAYQWSTTTYNDIVIDESAKYILQSDQQLTVEQAKNIPTFTFPQASVSNRVEKNTSQINSIQDSLIAWVDSDTRAISFVLNYGKKPEPRLELLSPRGNLISTSQANNSNVFYYNSSELGVKYFTIVKPETGKWKVRINGISQLSDTSYRLSYPMNIESPLLIQADSTFMSQKGDSTRIRIFLQSTASTFSNIRVTALYPKLGSRQLEEVALRDDGRNGDERANDKIYTGFFRPNSFGRYNLTAYMSGQIDGSTFSRQAFQTVQVGSDSQVTAALAEPRGFRLLTPPNRTQSISPTRIRFRWAAATQPIYNFQISTDTNFAYIPFNQFFTDTSVTITDFGAGRWYYWRVRPLGGDWSPVWSFYTGNLLAVAKAPNDGAALSSSSEPLRSFLAAANDDIINIINLKQHPNPFSHTTTLEYLLPREAHVRMDVCNMLGQTLITPVNGMETAGAHTVDVTMDGFPSGVYVVRMSVGGRVLTRQMTLIR